MRTGITTVNHGHCIHFLNSGAEPHEKRGSLVQVSALPFTFRGLMIVIAIGFIQLSPLIIVSTMVTWKSSLLFGKILCRVLDRRIRGRDGYVKWASRCNRNTVEKGVKYRVAPNKQCHS